MGYGLEGDLPDGKTGRMQDAYIIPLLSEDKFDEGIKNGYTAFLQEVSAVYDVTITGDEAISYEDEEGDLAIFVCLFAAFGVSVLGNQFLLKKNKKYATVAFWIVEALQVVVIAVILQNLLTALFVVALSLAFGFRFGGGGVYLGGGRFGGGFGGFGGGGGGGFRGGGGRSGGGGSSRGF